MTPEQFDRWKDFAMRMARTCFRNDARTGYPDTSWIVWAVEDFFGGLPDEDAVCYVDWDNSTNYPKGHRHCRRTKRRPCSSCNGNPGACDKHYCEDAYVYDYAKPYAMCDVFSEWETSYIYYDWHRLATEIEVQRSEVHEEVFGDDEQIVDEVVERWSGPVACCVRAGMDCESSPSAGVIGFTAGDIRRMYPEGVPDWVKGDEPWDSVPIEGIVPGVGFVPGEPQPNGKFDDMPDSASLWI
jgi:hypothetical protein